MGRDRVIVSDQEEMISFGKKFVSRLRSGDVLALSGDLGAGKTTFVQGLALGLGILEPIQSPTFVYLNQYRGNIPLFHFDLYRMHGKDDFLGMGFDEYFDVGGICAIEWPERAIDVFPKNAWHLSFSHEKDKRIVEIGS